MAVPDYGLLGGLVEIPSRSLADVDNDLDLPPASSDLAE
jgi:hypothetical protein